MSTPPPKPPSGPATTQKSAAASTTRTQPAAKSPPAPSRPGLSTTAPMANPAYTLTTPAQLLRSPGEPLMHRDVSWLQFNERVLAQAADPTNPLLERAKFVAISSSNLDEFFMIRFASITKAIVSATNKGDTEAAGRHRAVRTFIVREVGKLATRQKTVLADLTRGLDAHGIRVSRTAAATDASVLRLGKRIFDDQVLPHLLLPETFTFQKLSTLGNLQLAAIFGSAGGNKLWTPIPKSLPAAYWGREGDVIQVFFLDDLLLRHLGPAFTLKEAPKLVRLTRDGDLSVDLEEEDTESIPDVVRSSLGSRERGRPVRLQSVGGLNRDFTHRASSVLKIGTEQILEAPRTLCLHGLWGAVRGIPEEIARKPELSYPPLPSVIPPPFQSREGIFEILKARDLLLHHPYDSFDAFVGFIRTACDDVTVTAIDLTIYRTDAVSPIIGALKGAAARAGKKIRVMIELRARFDELNNLRLAEELRQAGIAVSFGFGQLKLHAKIALITRTEPGQPGGHRRYAHLSTGNYNAATARQYTDLSILTAHPEMVTDAGHFFDSVWVGHVPSTFKRMITAPTGLHRRMKSHIDAEIKAARAGRHARVFAKVNALVDEGIIRDLYEASQAGVKVDLVVRGACSLIPGVKGLSDNIRVFSIIDRFLEHSRIYWFESTRSMYFSSADWMPRNFFSRLEIAYPVLDDRLYRFMEEIVVPAYLSDTVKGRELTARGTWRARAAPKPDRPGRGPVRSQFFFEELSRKLYAGTPLAGSGTAELAAQAAIKAEGPKEGS